MEILIRCYYEFESGYQMQKCNKCKVAKRGNITFLKINAEIIVSKLST